MCVASVKFSAKSNSRSLLWCATINRLKNTIRKLKETFCHCFIAIFFCVQTAFILERRCFEKFKRRSSDLWFLIFWFWSWIQIWSSDLRNDFIESEIHLEFKSKQIGSTFERHKLHSFQRLRILLSFALLFILSDVADRKLFRNGSRTPRRGKKRVSQCASKNSPLD